MAKRYALVDIEIDLDGLWSFILRRRLRGAWIGREREAPAARAGRPRIEVDRVAVVGWQHRVAVRVALGHDRQAHGRQHDAATDSRRVRDDSLDEHLMAEHGRLDLGAHVALNREVVELTGILAEP